MTTGDWPLLPESIQTPRLLVRRFRLTDAEDVYAYARDSEWRRFLFTVPQPYERRHADEFVAANVLTDWRAKPQWAIECEGRVVGTVALWIDLGHGRAEFGYTLARWLWGRGLMTEVVSALIDEAFATLPLRKITARALAPNIGSIRVMEKAGMQFEAVLRQHFSHRGEVFDLVHYGLLREEWERQADARR
ncbi:MAG: GNAT family protein [Chloroflexi bacterium]|nr:GNAT family protein [Chloroflexota bacterium]